MPTGLVLARRGAETIVNGDLIVDEEKDAAGNVTGSFTGPRRALRRSSSSTVTLYSTGARCCRATWDFVGAAHSSGPACHGGRRRDRVLYYSKKEFTDFMLRLQWRAPTVRNNSGVYVRLPKADLGRPRPADQDRLRDPDRQHRRAAGRSARVSFSRPSCSTRSTRPGRSIPCTRPTTSRCRAICRTRTASRRSRRWPTAAGGMERSGDTRRRQPIRVVLNGVECSRAGDYVDQRNAYPRGLIGLQNHLKGLRVQFRHVRIKEGPPQF